MNARTSRYTLVRGAEPTTSTAVQWPCPWRLNPRR